MPPTFIPWYCVAVRISLALRENIVGSLGELRFTVEFFYSARCDDPCAVTEKVRAQLKLADSLERSPVSYIGPFRIRSSAYGKNSSMTSIGRTLVRGSAWMIAFRLLDRSVGLVSMLVLARV